MLDLHGAFSLSPSGCGSMYTSHFGLTEPPFSITPDPRFLYMSEPHREGLAHLLYGIRQPGGFVQLTGEVGTGKTTLCRCLLAQLPSEVDVALILNPRLTSVEFLATVCDELRVAYPANTSSIKVLVDALYRHLLEAHAKGRRTVLIIDEAQNLPPDVLEQIRLLTNLETATEKLLQIILIGQPELISLLARRKLRQLAQRVTARYHLLPFPKADTYAYIRHRLRVANGSDTLFTPAALRQVHRVSGGVPRLINVICDRALLGAYAHDQHRVDSATVRRAGREVRGAIPRGRRTGWLPWAFGSGVLGLALIVMAVLVTPGRISLPRSDGSPLAVSGTARPTPVVDSPDRGPQGQEGGPGHAARREGLAAGSGMGSRVFASPRLLDLLADPTIRRDDHGAFASLYSRWGLDDRRMGASPDCETGRSEGLTCLARRGNWNKLRRLDLPVIIELVTPTGDRWRVALVGLNERSARLELGGQEYTVPLDEIDRLWDGTFILVWKAPPIGSRFISPGMRGKDVEWIRSRLDELQGKVPEAAPSDLYDAELQARILAFQRSRSLVPDGVIGEETLVHLTLAAGEAGTPSLSRR
jgi:general secretion pathway protein A